MSCQINLYLEVIPFRHPLCGPWGRVENVDERDWNQVMKLEERPLALERAVRIRTGRAPARLAASIHRSRPRKTL
jgi:hypothetical protein